MTTTATKYTGLQTVSKNLGREEVGKEVFPEYNPPFNKKPYGYNRIFGEGYHNNENFRNYNTNMPKLDYPFLKEELVYRNIKVKKPKPSFFELFDFSEHDKIMSKQSIEFKHQDEKEQLRLELPSNAQVENKQEECSLCQGNCQRELTCFTLPSNTQKVEKQQRIKTKEEKRKERFILKKSLKGIYKKCCGDYGGRTLNGEYCLRSIYLNSDGLCKDHCY